MMDVHPLQTPNTVLTDCLNGTFITYNGNEHVLQNDMGNFKLEKCKLKENYIPIGTASYGDILYIASYNPIDKKFELGSYPSPLQWEDTSVDGSLSFQSILQTAVAQKKAEGQDPILYYTELGQYAHNSVFDKEEFKLLPGDKYKLEENLIGPKIEGFEYFILDENNVAQNIDDIEKNTTDPIPVSWQIPGNLGVTSSVLTPFSHKMSVLSVTTGPTTAQFNLRSVISIYDDRLLKEEVLDLLFKNISFKTEVFIDGQVTTDLNPTIEFGNGDKVKAYDSSGIYQWLYDKKQLVYEYTLVVNYGKENDENDAFVLHKVGERINEDGIIEKYDIYYERPTEIRCVPILRYDLDEDEREWVNVPNIILHYDNLRSSTTYTVNGQNQNMVAVDTFTWQYLPANTNVDINSKDSIVVTYDLFTQNDEARLAVFYKPLSALLGNVKFSIPETIKNETNSISAEEVYITKDARTVTLVDFPKNDFIVVFFQFLKPEDDIPTLDSQNLFTARFLYTGQELQDASGRADRNLSLQKTIDEYIENLKSNSVTVTLDANNSIYTSSKKTLLQKDLIESDFFNTTAKDETLFQTIIGKDSGIKILKDDSETLPTLNAPGFMEDTKVIRLYSLDNNDFSTDGYKKNVEVTIEHPIKHSSNEAQYDLSDVKSFIKHSEPRVRNMYWITNSRKAEFNQKREWDKESTTMFNSTVEYNNFHESMLAAWTGADRGTADEQLDILNLYVYKVDGNYSRIMSDASGTAYLTADKNGEYLGKTFILAGFDNRLGACVVQFDKSGSDNQETLSNKIQKLGYFTFKNNPTNLKEKWQKKNIYLYKVTQSDISVSDNLYTLYEKVKYDTTRGTSVYIWIAEGSELKNLSCYDYCDFDNKSLIEKIKFGETTSKHLSSKVTIENVESIDVKLKEYNEKWANKKESIVNQYSKGTDFANWKDIIENNSQYHSYKRRMYVHNVDGADPKLYEFAKCLTPDIIAVSNRKKATLSSDYYSKHSPNFYFGVTDNGKKKINVGFLKGFTEWLP